ncbi:MAG TPA: DUF1232 domain-containing protein [Longimicrobiaceae bacterium]|nr:DUF1232 domain-containing protein [Longimicrobiaceae bacterium]
MPEERERPRRRTRPRDLDESELVGPRRTEEDEPAPRRRKSAPRARRPVAEDDEELVGPRRMAGARPRPRPRDDEEEDEGEEDGHRRLPAPRLRRRPRAGDARDRETLKALIRDIPNFVKLFWRLARDRRVSVLDKALVAAVAAYVVSPIDLIPDIGVLGQVEDVYLLALVTRRLLNNAGIDVLLDHWDGELSSLEAALDALDRAGSVLPDRVRGLFGGQGLA